MNRQTASTVVDVSPEAASVLKPDGEVQQGPSADASPSIGKDDSRDDAKPVGRVSGFASIVDQCIFTGTNFLVSVVAGRFGGADELGQYALAFSVLIVTVGIQRALLMSPMVIVRGRFDELGRSQLRTAILVATLSIAAVGTIAAATVIYSMQILPSAWIGIFVIAFPAALLRDYVRRLAIYQLQIGVAIRIDTVIAALQLVALAWLVLSDLVQAEILLTVSSLIWLCVSSVALVLTRGQYQYSSTSITPLLAELWPIGRWVSLSAIVATTQSFVLPWIMAVAASLELAGIYAASWTIVQVVSPFIEGLGNLIGPQLAGQAERQSWSGLRRHVLTNTAIFAGIMAILLVALWFVGQWLLKQMYGPVFSEYFEVLMVLALASTANNLGIPVLKALVQLGHAKINFYISLVGLTVSLLLAWYMLRSFGPAGAAWGLVLGNGVASLARWIQFSSLETVVHRAADSTYARRI